MLVLMMLKIIPVWIITLAGKRFMLVLSVEMLTTVGTTRSRGERRTSNRSLPKGDQSLMKRYACFYVPVEGTKLTIQVRQVSQSHEQ